MNNTRQEQNRMNEPRALSQDVRTIIADGQRWIVREVAAPQFDRRGGPHLVFWGDTVLRRLRVFPANWATLSDDDLYALTERIGREP
jgi:hypothetical protein